jgi:elongation factor Ts
MSISAKQVMDLRKATDMPMMKCKKALEAEGGDFEKAIERLRKEGMKVAEARADRSTAEGLVRVTISDDRLRGSFVAVACETEPVAKTPRFVEFVDRLAVQVADRAPENVDTLLAQPWIDDEGRTVDDVLRDLVGVIRENIRIQAIANLQVAGTGLVGSYLHYTNKDAALVALGAEAVTDELADLAKQLCMHIVFAKPSALSRDDIPETLVAKETEIARAQVEQDPKMSNKPAQVIDKIVEGKIGAFYKQSVLGEQDWVVDPSRKCTVSELLKQHGATLQAFDRVHVGG